MKQPKPLACVSLRFTLLVLTCVVCAACAPKTQHKNVADSNAASVVTARVEARELALPIEAIGTVHAIESVVITSRVSGRVSRIHMKEGAHVAAGDPLVSLEDDAERAELRTASAAAAEAIAQYERLEALAEKGLVSHYERDRQRRAVEAAQAQLELSRVLLEQRTIRAPFTGVVGFRKVSLGTLVQPGTAIVSLDAIDQMRVQFSVAETLISNIGIGDVVHAHSAAYRDRTYEGRIETRGTRVDEITRSVPVQAIFSNADGSLLPGMMLTLRILGRPRMLTHVPEAALAPENARQFVWRIDESGTAQRVPVEIGVRGSGWVEIVSGLLPGERVVLEGAGNLRPGISVREVPRPGSAVAAVHREET